MINHLQHIQTGQVTKSNVIGIRKALNALSRPHWASKSATAPKIDWPAMDAILSALDEIQPCVIGDLHDSGLKQLQTKRYAKQLASVADRLPFIE
jgi:hypothetical protein